MSGTKLLRTLLVLSQESRNKTMTRRAQYHSVNQFLYIIIVVGSAKTGASKMSLRSQVLQTIKEEGGDKRDWDPSVKSEYKPTAEEKVATRLANEVLRENTKLRGIHSHSSIKKLLEKEAKR